jgi:hypothetical protein
MSSLVVRMATANKKARSQMGFYLVQNHTEMIDRLDKSLMDTPL